MTMIRPHRPCWLNGRSQNSLSLSLSLSTTRVDGHVNVLFERINGTQLY